MRNRWVISESPEELQANCGSRYAPTAPLAGLEHALERHEPFAVTAKPCDLGALHTLSAVDPRIDQLGGSAPDDGVRWPVTAVEVAAPARRARR